MWEARARRKAAYSDLTDFGLRRPGSDETSHVDFLQLASRRISLALPSPHSVSANTNSVQPPGNPSVSGQICGKSPATADPQPTGTAMYWLLLTE